MKNILFVLYALVAFHSCNIFEPFSEPSTDAELLSAARACLDQGDLECAKKNYQKVSKSYSEERSSELAFLLLDQAGASMGVFMEAFGGGGGGTQLTKLINRLAPIASENRRLALFAAFQQIEGISTLKLRGLVRFVSSIALVAHLLAEDAGADRTFTRADLADDPESCLVSTCVVPLPACDKTGSLLTAAAVVPGMTDLQAPSAASFTGSPHWGMFHGALLGAQHALFEELEAQGKFREGAGKLLQALALLDPATNTSCYRFTLLDQGVGR
jgi:hypothetical protein